MGIVRFDPKKLEGIQAFLEEVPDIQALSCEALQTYCAQTRQIIADLDALEPCSETSEAYDRWAELHEDLEDVLDEILDCLDDC